MDYEEYWNATWDGKNSLTGQISSEIMPGLWSFELKVKIILPDSAEE